MDAERRWAVFVACVALVRLTAARGLMQVMAQRPLASAIVLLRKFSRDYEDLVFEQTKLPEEVPFTPIAVQDTADDRASVASVFMEVRLLLSLSPQCGL